MTRAYIGFHGIVLRVACLVPNANNIDDHVSN